ncbi:MULTISPECIES: FMN reductase [Methylovorus]|jgi:FMN reductase|uniref:FMN reductase n=1 Tax=Methylovorus glucosotrophus (strain SIP3-4) TaxID=582744 RepID=C6X747_METGS|nr:MULTISPECIES: FMN reductase [Methylovorus]ACT51190.1 FMN reductase [Methylovorus glucosotrophus SIP3-4]ADQ85117.1 FMN reductase [Methylovorus sp. MP688]
MSKKLKVTAVAGSTSRPSRTLTLVEEIAERLGKHLPIELKLIELGELGPDLGASLNYDSIKPAVRKAIDDIESADVLIFATPVYRGSYTGLLKHLFDLVHYESLIDVPVLLAATGGSLRHSLVIEHQLRPMFSFFQSLTLPVGVYAIESEFTNYKISNEALDKRIDLAIERALPFLKHRELATPEAAEATAKLVASAS